MRDGKKGSSKVYQAFALVTQFGIMFISGVVSGSEVRNRISFCSAFFCGRIGRISEYFYFGAKGV